MLNRTGVRNVMGKFACALSILIMLGTLVADARPAFAETSPVPPTPPTAVPAIPPVGAGMATVDIAAAQQLYQINLRAYQAQLSGYAYEMRAYQMKTWEWRIKTALVGGLLDAMALVTQRLAYQTAQLILTGGNSQEPMFWNQPIGTWLENTANDASSVFLGRLDDQITKWTAEKTGISFGLCHKPDPLTLKLALSIGKQGMIPPGSCSISQMKDNFEAIADMVESGDAVDIQRPQFVAGPNNDLSATLSINYLKMNDEFKKERDALLERTESKGMKQVTDVVSGKIKFPSLMTNESLMNMDPVKMMNENKGREQSAMLDAFWQTGLEGVAWITLSTFVNTMVVGVLERIFKQDPPGGDSINASEQQIEWTFEAIKNQDASGDAQDLYERQSFAKALGDYIVPNYSSQEDRDLIGELMTCVTPRGRWSCSMDQAFAVAIMTGGADGALTVGRASGVGMEKAAGQVGQGLHPDWELIPESDIKNNSDPACAQRAYCAGNLKKLRLARILPIGWEMAANSPYNIKKNGKYISLSEVIRGYFECNDQGQLDNAHPWCHLIDPNWILTAPKYQCRAKGYGDNLMPNVGTRMEECGDVVTCLSTNQKGECVGGYGYCMAERPVYRFDAQECESQFASCRTWQSSKGATLSGLRYTVDRGACSEENIGCQWYATDRSVTSTKSPDGLWVGTVTSGPRVVLDATAQPCTSEGCSKMLRIDAGKTALNLVNNGSFEQDVPGSTTFQSFVGWGWDSIGQCAGGIVPLAADAFEGVRALGNSVSSFDKCFDLNQNIAIVPNRNYSISFYYKVLPGATLPNKPFRLSFFKNVPGQEFLPVPVTSVATYQDCTWDAQDGVIVAKSYKDTGNWERLSCQFVSPKGTSNQLTADDVYLSLEISTKISFDDIQLEEGEFVTPFVDGVADLESTYLKIAPDEYACTGNDAQDNPACKRFARMCRQPDVGCQGYKDTEDASAPEVPATLSVKDQCPAICAGYGEYRKLPSSFDLVKDESHPQFSDPEDDGVAYFVPSLADKCTLADVGCESFTSMEAATSTGETIYHFNGLRSCEKPNDKTATYFTWEGSDITGYQLRTWSLIASSVDPNDHGPKVLLKGAAFGSVKDPATCNEITWKNGTDPDCLQFYDANSTVYYRYYSQTVSSDPACTLMRKNDSSLVDCGKTGGDFQAQTKSCMYQVLVAESASCSANAGGCRAYMGPTGRNAANVFYETFVDAKSSALISVGATMKPPQLSKESVLVGDQSLKLEPMNSGAALAAELNVPVPSTSTLYRISFWAKANSALQAPSTITIDNAFTATFKPDVKWKRFEVGPFYVKGNVATASTPNAQKTCGSFALSPSAMVIGKTKNMHPEMTDAEALVFAKLVVANYWNNSIITKNAVQASGKVCAADTDCQNLNIYYSDSEVLAAGSASGKCGYKSAIALVKFNSPANTNQLYIDTIRVDQLNDIQFVRKNQWSVPAACDATYPEGVPEPRAMLGCRAYSDRDGNTAFVRSFSSLCSQDAIGCKAFIDTRGRTNPYPETKEFKGTAGPSKHTDKMAASYDEQFLGDWSVTTKPYRYYYAIDDARGVCDSGENMCRAFGQPLFTQDRLALGTGTSTKDADKFKTVLLKDDWSQYTDENGEPKMACRKDELFCDRFQSGNVTEYFRDPGNHSCVWQKAKNLKVNQEFGIYSEGNYSGWFREGTDIPCYPSYLGSGDTFLLNYTAENPYAGWMGKCPVDQSECTEFVDPNDTSDPIKPEGRSYFMINSSKIDTRSCGGSVDPLAGCILFNNKGVSGLMASAKATYAKVQAELGASTNGVDCEKDSGNPYCQVTGYCDNFVKNTQSTYCPGNWDLSLDHAMSDFNDQTGGNCQVDTDCKVTVKDYPNKDCTMGVMNGTCNKQVANDANIVLKVKLDRECARWMGCRTGETVFDSAAQKFVNRCSQLEMCEKNGSNSEDIFCAKFTDRKKEDYLKPGQFVSLENYSSRKVGFGKMDYSGYTIPNQYVLADIHARAVGYDLLQGSNKENYRYDERMVAEVPMGQDVVMAEDLSFTNLPSDVKLCQDKRTNRFGYTLNQGKTCYLAINEPQALSFSVGGKQGNDLSRDVQRIYEEFVKGSVSAGNAGLQGSMPSPECQLYPEENSPLPNQFVAKWNTKIDPPVSVAMVEGYENANACVYGEDCSCSYRKVRYQGGVQRYYAVDGTAPLIGVCQGGDRDGQGCVPGGYTAVNSKNQVLASVNNGVSTEIGKECGGGMCEPIQDVVMLNGRFGYCLERDKTRVGVVSNASAPCLTWAPQVVEGGKYDTVHRSPTAGYMPPQGSGEYYCVSGANEQKVTTPNTLLKYSSGSLKYGDYFWAPGDATHFDFSRADVYYGTKYSSRHPAGSTNASQGGVDSFVGAATQNMMFACRRTSLCEGYNVGGTVKETYLGNSSIRWLTNPGKDGGLDSNVTEGLWVATGDKVSTSYTEYFIPYIEQPKTHDLQGYQLNENSLDFKFGLFRFSITPFGAGSACKWNPAWLGMNLPSVQEKNTDGKNPEEKFSCSAYLSEIGNLSNQFYSQFKQSFSGVLDRGSESIYKDAKGLPVRLGCVDNPDEKVGVGSGSSCYFKSWETGFQNAGQSEFVWPEKHMSQDFAFNFWRQAKAKRYYSTQCGADKPFFGIRAMFQNMNKIENAYEPDAVANGTRLEGPWQFVGFWVTACLPTNRPNNPGLLYMKLDIVRADVCRQVAQVISPNTRESAVFADRVWMQGGFFLPVLGVRYQDSNEPFGSALTVGKIGKSPMLRGASVPLSDDPSTSPTFIDSGLGMQPLFMTQQQSYAVLSNLFARIYKVYRWESSLVTKDDWACVSGNNQGKLCGSSAGLANTRYEALRQCTGYATCDPNVDVDIKNQNWRCNTLSGVNRGLHCGDETPRNVDALCHNSPVAVVKNTIGNFEKLPMYGLCKETGILEYHAKPTVLSELGVCKSTAGSCGIKAIFNPDTTQGQYPQNVVKTYQGICTPYETELSKFVTTYSTQVWNVPNDYASTCLYNEDDDENAAMPSLAFKYEACDGQPDLVIAMPDKSSILSHKSNDTLLVVFEAIKKAAEFNKLSKCKGEAIDPGYDTLIGVLRNYYKIQAYGVQDRLQIDIQNDFGRLIAQGTLRNIQEGLLQYWDKQESNDILVSSKVPTKFDFGTYNQDTLANRALYLCDNGNGKVVNPGARCGNPGQYSVDCPRRIDACSGTQLATEKFTYTDKQNIKTEYDVPACGLCVKGDPDDYYRNEAQFSGTGFCKGFNQLARCNTNQDCRFTEFEYWGAYDYGNAEGKRYGGSEWRVIYSAETESLQAGEQAPIRRLPTPLFEDVDNENANSNYITEVPKKYSDAAIYSSLGLSKLKSGNVMESIFNSLDNDDCHYDPAMPGSSPEELFDNSPLECQEAHVSMMNWSVSGHSEICPIEPMRRVCDKLLETANDPKFKAPATNGCLDRELDYSDVADDTQDADFEEFWCEHAYLTEITIRCYQTCGTMALMMPNSYAQNFDAIAASNVNQAKVGKNYRNAAVAPFAINPLIRTLKSIGYVMDTVNKWGWQDSDDEWHTMHFAAVIEGFWTKGSFIFGKQGQYWPDTVEIFPKATFYSVGESYYSNWLVDRLLSFTHLKDIAAADLSKLFNDSFPWDSNKLYFTTLFPLIFDNSASSINTNKDKTSFISDYDSIWSGYGYSASLKEKFDKLVETQVKAIVTNNAHCTWEYPPAPAVPVQKCDEERHLQDVGYLDAVVEFKRQYIKDMKTHYFDQTGWGVFMDPGEAADGSMSNQQLQLYPGATPAAVPSEDKLDRPYTVFVPGHCEPPPGGTDTDSFNGDYYNITGVADDVQKGSSIRPEIVDTNSGALWFNSRPMKSPWVSESQLSGNSSPDPIYDSKGLIDSQIFEWTPVAVVQGSGESSADIELPGPAGALMKNKVQTCRCVGGTLDGQVVESEFQCNENLSPEKDPKNFVNSPQMDWEYCKPVTGSDWYKTEMSKLVGQTYQVEGKAYSYGITQDYVNGIKSSLPLPECRLSPGVGNTEAANPDLDENGCTHLPGYLPRFDLCRDGREQCLLTYDLTDSVSVNNLNLEKDEARAPSATDVTSGLDAFSYISGGNHNQDGKEYVSYYRPSPPRVAAPDVSKTSQSSNAPSVVYMDSFSVDNSPEGELYYGGGQGLATLRSYAWAAHEQGPIKSVIIDWGDGTVQKIENTQLKNYKPLCNVSSECEYVPGFACSGDADCPPAGGACLPTGSCQKQTYKTCHKDADCGGDDTCMARMLFGNSSDACRQGFMEFSHIYTCSKEGINNLKMSAAACDTQGSCENLPDLSCDSSATCRSGEACVKGLAKSGGCYNQLLNRCRYTPKIQIIDSWGWCTGDCTQKDEMSPAGSNSSYKIRHPYGGCWDGSKTKFNTALMSVVPSANTLANECNPSQQDLSKYRPWIVYKGSVEVSPAN